MNDRLLTDEILTVRFTEPVEGPDPDDGETVIASRHRVLAVGLRQDRHDTLFLDAAGEVVGRWPTVLVDRIDWSPKLSVSVTGGRKATAGRSRIEAIREKYPQAFTRWQPDEDERLVAEFHAGRTMAEMVALHGRARGGITSRLIHLGLVDPNPAGPEPSG